MNILALAQQIENDYGVVIGRADLSKPLSEENQPVIKDVNFSPYTDYAQGGFVAKRLMACCFYGGGIGTPFFITIISKSGDDDSWVLADDGANQLRDINMHAQQAEVDAKPVLTNQEIEVSSAAIKADIAPETVEKVIP